MQTSGCTCLLEPNESIRLCNKSSFNSPSVMSRMAVIKLGSLLTNHLEPQSYSIIGEYDKITARDKIQDKQIKLA